MRQAGRRRPDRRSRDGHAPERRVLSLRRGVEVGTKHQSADRTLSGPGTTTPGGRLVFNVFAAPAEFIRELIAQGTNEGLDAARARGARLGRPSAMTEERVRHGPGPAPELRPLLRCRRTSISEQRSAP
ncbi:recombinase family protein [Streptomyces sp. NPDC006510]|uniref:recombinase family protein n=1 Tax=Streptomyces sp. NPDC006510 TaxID=3155600 RepID=UPI0033B50C42